MPCDAEAGMKRRGALHRKLILPLIVVDSRVVTGRNRRSAKATAKAVARLR
jgi:hypothetical protein